MTAAPQSKPFIRKALSHGTHFAGRFGATYFITICCRERYRNQLCQEKIWRAILETAVMYDTWQHWYVKLLLLMPDHLHALVARNGDIPLGRTIGNFKRATTKFAGVEWQRNFFDHRLRNEESLTKKAAYIRQNPVRAGLIRNETDWLYVLDRSLIESGGSVNRRYLK
jgi:putative transposase